MNPQMTFRKRSSASSTGWPGAIPPQDRERPSEPRRAAPEANRDHRPGRTIIPFGRGSIDQRQRQSGRAGVTMKHRLSRLEGRITQASSICVRYEGLEGPCDRFEHPTSEDCDHCPNLCIMVKFVKGDAE